MNRYLIVGGVAGGASAAARLRRMDEEGEILLFERGESISYANCGLPYYLGGTIKEREKLFLQTPESFGRRFRVDVRTRSEVVSIDREKKRVQVRELSTGRTYREEYTKLLLSPGAEPVRPPLPGIDHPLIFTLRNVPDTDRIARTIEENRPRRALIIGAGFIGLEMAENLHNRGISVTIVEMMDQVMAPLDYEMAAFVHQHLKSKGVGLFLKERVASFRDEGGKPVALLESGLALPADLVILSIGVKPETRLASEAGLSLGERGGIRIDHSLQTDDPSIYAVGDAVETVDLVTKRPSLFFLAGPANRQARIAADNMVLGNHRVYQGTVGTAIAKVFDMTVAATGHSERSLKREKIPFLSSIVHVGHHAGYYPGAIPLSIKLLFSPEGGRLLGAQVVGYDGVDKRIDLLAATLRRGGTVSDLGEIEHSYAPPFSSAKDPVNIAGFAAENLTMGRLKNIGWNEVTPGDSGRLLLLDVRTPEEFSLGTIPGALNIPVDDLRKRIGELPTGRGILVFCAVGLRGYIASRILIQSGFKEVYNLSGGYKTYSLAKGEQENRVEPPAPSNAQEDPDSPARRNNGSPSRRVPVDAGGLQCPGPILRLKEEIGKLSPLDVLTVQATDPGFSRDLRAWSQMTGHRVLSVKEERGVVEAEIEKGEGAPDSAPLQDRTKKGTTLVVFSDDLDKALATFVIANGAAALGKQVTLFFTFWGLNILRKRETQASRKEIQERLFGWMMPRGSSRLSLSRMNLLGIGSRMIKSRMARKNIASLERMIEEAKTQGVEMVACQMSMDLMGLRREELIDGVEVGGVASYLSKTEGSSLNLFL